MDQALAPIAPQAIAEVPPPSTPMQRLMAMPAGAKMKLGAGLAMLVALVVAMAIWSNQGDWKVLFSNLPDKDAGAVVAQLSQMNVPYKFAEGGGGVIMVPADKVHDARLKLAASGLPKASTVGFEILDKGGLPGTAQQERVNYQRGLEGELTRTITSLAAVSTARVHLALPQQNGFFREQQKPSASVMLTLHPGRTLDRAQVAGIVHLVSSSVPELSPKAVSVLDQTGALLTESEDHNAQGLDPTQLQYVSQLETGYLKRIQELLEPVVGRENLRATVTADVDFSQSEATQEQFKPNQGDQPAAVRSSQTSESTTPGTGATPGIPGAASNQPPVPATAPINGASAPLQAAQSGGNGSGQHKEAVTNYELDRTVRVTRNPTGVVRRINAAVVVNYRTVTDAKGKSSTTALPQEEIDKLTSLVQEAIGYSQPRNDSVKVITAPFRVAVPPKEDELPLWKQPWVLDLLRVGAVPFALALVALGVVFGLVRPAVMAAIAPPPKAEDEATLLEAKGGNLDAVVDGDNLLPGGENGLPALEAPGVNPKLEAARLLAKDNPAIVANILRDWIAGEAG